MLIFIKSNDTLFSRMLELELELCGHGTVGSPDEADMLLVDTDSTDILPSAERPCIFFGRKEPERFTGRFLRRPFLISELVSLLPKKDNEPVRTQTVPDRPEIKLGQNGTVIVNGKEIALSKSEHALLALLLERRGRPVSREEAASAIFPDAEDASNVCDVYVCYLRKKLDEPLGIKLIRTVRGKGYMIEL